VDLDVTFLCLGFGLLGMMAGWWARGIDDPLGLRKRMF